MRRSGFRRKGRIEQYRSSARKRARRVSDRPITGDVTAMARGYANELAKNPTDAERRVYEALSRSHINFLFQYPLYIRNADGEVVRFYIADFYLPEKGCIVEVDGGYVWL